MFPTYLQKIFFKKKGKERKTGSQNPWIIKMSSYITGSFLKPTSFPFCLSRIRFCFQLYHKQKLSHIFGLKDDEQHCCVDGNKTGILLPCWANRRCQLRVGGSVISYNLLAITQHKALNLNPTLSSFKHEIE